MISWLVRRVAVSALLIFVLLSAVFFIVRLAPGDPVDQVVEDNLGPDSRELIRRQMGLDESLFRQYLSWLAASSRGDFGTSLSQQRSVAGIIGEALPATLLLTVTAYLLHLLLALGAAIEKDQPLGSLLQERNLDLQVIRAPAAGYLKVLGPRRPRCDVDPAGHHPYVARRDALATVVQPRS